jgi:tRNA threonylcarbamoyl adenosine modification protein YeaZ
VTASQPRRHDGRNRAILALDTATSRVVVAVGTPDGEPLGLSYWQADHRHGEQLLPSIGRALGEANVRRSRLEAIVAGTGPGAFTGLRVGLATAKGLAHGLGRPLVGVPTSEALIEAAAAAEGIPAARVVLLLPAGPSDRVVARLGAPARLIAGGTDVDGLHGDDVLVAVDLDGRAPLDAVERGALARDGLGPQLLRLGAARLASSGADDLAALVPEYVTLPRGVAASVGEVTWSPDPR